MKFDIGTQETSLEGGVKIGEFGITNTAHIIEILRSSIYKDKVLAVIREYSTNAVDAHVANKVSKPIQVVCPDWSQDSPIFSVRDFGTGISPENMVKIFLQYGESTKGDDDSQTGMLGIGCKSGFAYGDNFTVTSWYNGEKSVYNCVKNESGCGEIQLLSRQSSEEESGVEIVIPVSYGDIHEFKSKCAFLFSFFDFPIDVSNTQVNKVEFTFDGVSNNIKYGFKFRASTSYLIMGNIPYEIDNDKFKEYEQYLKLGTYIYAPIGAVDVAASRESLRYTDKTKLFIKNFFSSFSDIIKEYAVKRLESIEDLESFCTYVNGLDQYSKDLYKSIEGLNWRGFPFKSSHSIDSETDDYSILLIDTKGRLELNRNGYELSFARGVSIIIENENSSSRVLSWYKKSCNSNEIVILFRPKTPDAKQKFLEVLPFSDSAFELYSNIRSDYKNRVVTSRSSYSSYGGIYRDVYSKKIVEFKHTSYSTYSDNWTTIDKEEFCNQKEIVYVNIWGYAPDNISLYQLNYLCLILKSCGLTPKIYGVKPKTKIGDNFITFQNYLKKHKDILSAKISEIENNKCIHGNIYINIRILLDFYFNNKESITNQAFKDNMEELNSLLIKKDDYDLVGAYEPIFFDKFSFLNINKSNTINKSRIKLLSNFQWLNAINFTSNHVNEIFAKMLT